MLLTKGQAWKELQSGAQEDKDDERKQTLP